MRRWSPTRSLTRRPSPTSRSRSAARRRYIAGPVSAHCVLHTCEVTCEALHWSGGGKHAPPDPAKPGMTGSHMKEGMYCKRRQPGV